MRRHGEFKINIIGRVVEVEVTGAWNASTAKEFVEEFQRYAVRLENSPWGVIVDTTKWELSTPDTEPIIANLLVWCMKHNQRYEATIVGESELKKYQSGKYYQPIDTSKIEQRYFISTNEAIEWFSNIELYNVS